MPVAIRDGTRAGPGHRRRAACGRGERRTSDCAALDAAERRTRARSTEARARRGPGRGEAGHRRRAGRCPAAARHALPEDQLGGTVTTDAVTLAGRDFYTYFSQTWSEIPLSERYMVAIHERPSGRYGSLIWVEFQQKRVFQTFLPIARANVKAVAESAASISFQTVIQDDLSNLLFPDSDLAKDEI
ncbi:curli production assembly/transport protein CsgE [Burkholderia contaminans]|uniref:CsgE family curli-type amyloid fiber assembly protein n=1 Tax=Burkholderia contaminans TaxID=488447 RepID=UPI002415269E|nr:CsgE family curli-type amyloid fiber assembly protein [Burkholderia contaminans]WFN05360.1 curli production assembly/transport protein CsgE [Burkholderia contaminans]